MIAHSIRKWGKLIFIIVNRRDMINKAYAVIGGQAARHLFPSESMPAWENLYRTAMNSEPRCIFCRTKEKPTAERSLGPTSIIYKSIHENVRAVRQPSTGPKLRKSYLVKTCTNLKTTKCPLNRPSARYMVKLIIMDKCKAFYLLPKNV